MENLAFRADGLYMTHESRSVKRQLLTGWVKPGAVLRTRLKGLTLRCPDFFGGAL
jgi:hypothetical protein